MNNKKFYNNLFLNNKIIASKKLYPSLTSIKSDSNNTSRILIFTLSELVPEEKNLLNSILKACQIQPEDYLLIPQKTKWNTLNKAHIKEVILFGVNEKELDLIIDIPMNWPTRFEQKVWIKTNSIHELMNNKNLKNALWQNALKPYFLPEKKPH